MHHEISRRELVMGAVLASALLPAFAAEPTPLDPNDPVAKALAFVTDASQVDAKANPTFKPEQRCANCTNYLGKPTDGTAGCKIFAGHSVPAGGWCKSWVQRTG